MLLPFIASTKCTNHYRAFYNNSNLKSRAGVDWKSLTIPACLPITTDYFPEERALQTDYVFSIYNLSPVESTDFVQQRSGARKPLTASEVFNELISQRLAQGFQLVLRPNVVENSSSVVRKRTTDVEQMYFLSIGRVFHKVELAEHTMGVTRHRPRLVTFGFYSRKMSIHKTLNFHCNIAQNNVPNRGQ